MRKRNSYRGSAFLLLGRRLVELGNDENRSNGAVFEKTTTALKMSLSSFIDLGFDE